MYVLQRLHDVISNAAVEDMHQVTKHVRAHGLQAPALLQTKSGQFVAESNGARWRLYPWIDGVVVDRVRDADMAHEAGRIVGELHRALASLPYVPQGSIPHFHDTEYVLAELTSVLHELPVEVAAIGKRVAELLPQVIVGSEAGQKQLIHGDLKISNILFSDSGTAVGVIDFDTVLFHYRTIDIGDALRSWCNSTSEADPRATFDVALFASAAAGYEGGPVSDDHTTLYLRATKHIALELSARFLTDSVRDSYFGWDQDSYPTRIAHNVARAVGQFQLAESIPL